MTYITDLIKAADFAAKKHRDQKRKDPEETPYINHPIGVANILANEGLQLQNTVGFLVPGNTQKIYGDLTPFLA